MQSGEFMRILIVEDEKRLADTIAEIMQKDGNSTEVSYDGEEGLDNAMSGIFDAIILDVMLPYVNGFEIVRRMRKSNISTPVLMLTAKAQTADKVTGLESGADYYLTKPFETSELLACVHAISRRRGEVVMDELTFGDITLSLSTFELRSPNKRIGLRRKEFDVLRLLLMNSNQIVTKETILLKIWGVESNAEDNNVEVYISFLRKKLAFVGSKVSINTVRNIGYKLEVQEDKA